MQHLLLIILVFSASNLAAQIEPVFALPEDQEVMKELAQKYPDYLSSQLDDNLQQTFLTYIELLKEMENKANVWEVDIRGVKTDFWIYFSPEGVIDHIVYRLRPDGKNIDSKLFEGFLTGFIRQYRLSDVEADTGYIHFGKAAFPVYMMAQ